LRITTNFGTYIIDAGLEKEHINVFEGMQQAQLEFFC